VGVRGAGEKFSTDLRAGVETRLIKALGKGKEFAATDWGRGYIEREK